MHDTHDAEFGEVKAKGRTAVLEIPLDVVNARDTTDEIIWITSKTQVVELVSHYFRTNGYLPNSRHPSQSGSRETLPQHS